MRIFYPAPLNGFYQWRKKTVKHIRDMESKMLDTQKQDTQRGQVFAFSVIVLFMLVTIIAMYLNMPWVAGIVSGTTIVSVVGAFLQTHKKK